LKEEGSAFLESAGIKEDIYKWKGFLEEISKEFINENH